MGARDLASTSGLSPFPPADPVLDEIEAVIDEMDRLFEREDTSGVDLDDLQSVLDIVAEGEWQDHARDAIYYLWSLGHRPIGIGTTRVTFAVGEHMVAKVPIDYRGVLACDRESYLSAKSGKHGEIPIADCDMDDDMLIMWMERVEPVSLAYDSDSPGWLYLIDCGQAGYDRDGVLVAYDL